MSYEKKTVDLINSVMPNSPLRESISGEVDSEVIRLGEEDYLFTTDDFSKEDLLRENDPYVLGWNIACGAVSDIIAAGGIPLTYSHSMVIPHNWNEDYIMLFSQGISNVLQKYSISFIGGDLGVGDDWRYTATVIGKPLGRLVNRKGCIAGDSIFITGKIGAGNIEAVLSLFAENKKINKLIEGVKTQFRTHEKIPELISKYASCAIDTSDGLFAALQTITKLNRTGFMINNLPFVDVGVSVSDILQLPDVLLFLGECGEYEILFTVSEQSIEAMKAEIKKHGIEVSEIGKITENIKQKTVVYKNTNLDLEDYNIRARDYYDIKDYLKIMVEWVEKRIESR